MPKESDILSVGDPGVTEKIRGTVIRFRNRIQSMNLAGMSRMFASTLSMGRYQ